VNAPPGALLETWEGCPSGGFATLAQIGYTPHTVTATIVAPPPLASVQSLLTSVLKPKGKYAKIGYLLAHGGFAFSWPKVPGLLSVYWTAKVDHKQVMVAVVNAPSFNGSQATPVVVKLTKAGKQLLKSATKLKVSAAGFFGPTWDPKVELKAHTTFTLKH
jgi:hypothetical protein